VALHSIDGPKAGEVRVRWERWPLGILLVAIGGGVLIAETSFRGAEAWGASAFARGVFSVPSTAYPSVAIYEGLNLHDGILAIRITLECTAAIAVAALCFFGAGALFIRNVQTLAVVGASTLSVLVMLLFNELRLAFLAAAFHWWGLKHGFEVAHIFYGSIISVVGMVLAVVVFVVVLVRFPDTRRRIDA